MIGSQIEEYEVKQHLTLHLVHIYHIVIRSKLRYLIGAKGLSPWEWGSAVWLARAKHRGFISGPGNNPSKTEQVKFLDCSGTELKSVSCPNPDHWRVTQTLCSHYLYSSSRDTHQVYETNYGFVRSTYLGICIYLEVYVLSRKNPRNRHQTKQHWNSISPSCSIQITSIYKSQLQLLSCIDILLYSAIISLVEIEEVVNTINPIFNWYYCAALLGYYLGVLSLICESVTYYLGSLKS